MFFQSRLRVRHNSSASLVNDGGSAVQRGPVLNQWGDQFVRWTLQRAIRAAGEKVPGQPPDFRFHNLGHYLASVLIASGADVKIVQARLRHASAKTTLDTCTHLWPDSDESTRTAIDAVMQERSANQLIGSVAE